MQDPKATDGVGAQMPMVALAGTPEQIGTIWGETNSEIIVRDLEAAYQLGAATKGDTACWEALEQPMRADKERLKGEAASAVAVGEVDQAAESLERWSRTQAQTLVEAMQQPG